MDSPEIFDRVTRRLRRDRAARRYCEHDFLRALMLEGIYDRLASVKREFSEVLDLGSFDGAFTPPPGATITRIDAGATFAAAVNGIQADEDHLPVEPHRFDLIISAGVLDSVGDVPGALTQIRRALRPDGLFLGAFIGGMSLSTARAAFLAAEAERPAARFHPMIDVRSAGDLLVRAGFALPVADSETVRVRYADLFGLIGDLRGMAASNVLNGRVPLSRRALSAAASAFSERADADGRTAERFDLIFLTGWAPSPDQPQPARRGSATTSLASALRG